MGKSGSSFALTCATRMTMTFANDLRQWYWVRCKKGDESYIANIAANAAKFIAVMVWTSMFCLKGLKRMQVQVRRLDMLTLMLVQV